MTMRNPSLLGAAAATLAAGAIFAATSAGGSSTATTLRVYEHDTSQASVDLGDKGDSAGDQFVFAGDTSKSKGAPKNGRAAGACTTMSTGARGEVICTVNFALPGGQLSSQGLFVSADLFGGRTLTAPITGGTGRYRHARGDATVHIPQDVPDLADAEFVLRLR
jgi:hypothetical protein